MKEKYKIVIIFALYCIIFMQLAEATNISIEITLDKNHYNYSEKIQPLIILYNNENENLTVIFYEEFKHLNEEMAPYFYSETVILPAKTEINLSKIYLFVFDYYPEGEYQVYAEIRDEENNLLASVTKGFYVHIPKDIDLNLLICKEESCSTLSKIFYPKENVYFDFQTSVIDLKISGVLIYPNNKQENISLPSSIKISQIGAYAITITASKDGYKTITKTQQFAIIEHETNIISVSICNANRVCNPDENYQNCPQDCPSGGNDGYCDGVADGMCDPDCSIQEDVDCKPVDWIYLIIGAVIIMIIIGIYYQKSKRSRKITQIPASQRFQSSYWLGYFIGSKIVKL